jgi:hypothetical protein
MWRADGSRRATQGGGVCPVGGGGSVSDGVRLPVVEFGGLRMLASLVIVTTVSTIPFLPDGWDPAAGFPAMTGNVAFTMKDVVFFAVSVYLLKQDVVRASRSAVERHESREVGEPRATAAAELAAK